MARKKTQTSRDILDIALGLAAEQSWSALTLEDIADAAKVPVVDVYRQYGNKSGILLALARNADAEVLADGLDDLEGESVRDALFDLLMRRFDALAPYKAGLRAIITEARHQPGIIMPLLPQLGRSMTRMLEAAGDDMRGPAAKPRIAALSLLWLNVMRIWLHDDSPDLAKTMAALDKALDRAEAAANSLGEGPVAIMRNLFHSLRQRDAEQNAGAA
jgi:AcrR family transcriptional regulator